MRPFAVVRVTCVVPVHLALALATVACAGPAETHGLSVVAPTTLGEGHNDGHAFRPNTASGPGALTSGSSSARRRAATNPDGGAPETSAASSEHGAQPDPTPLVTAHQWDLTLHYAKGTVSLKDAKPAELRTAAPTPRRIGRFAVELWVGRELVDRVRFDFPLLGADWPPGADRSPTRGAPRFSPGADTVSTVRVPDSERATAAQVVDRLTGNVAPIPWPPAARAAAASTP